MIIGLTGGTGTGKTSVSRYFERAGYDVIDYDLITREIYKKGSACLKEIAGHFGSEILTSDGELDRRALGAIVFADKKSLEKLNSIVYKYIIEYTEDIIENSKDKKLLLDAPTLFEAGLQNKCDKLIGVIAPKELRVERVMQRDNLERERVIDRINSQKDDDFYIKNCDYIINNNGSVSYMEAQASDIIREIENELHPQGK